MAIQAEQISLHQLRVFQLVAELRSFSLAAERMRLTQPTLSAVVRNLERAIGERVFDRNTRSLALTPVGRELVGLARRVLGEFDRAIHELDEYIGTRRGRVRLAAMPQVYGSLLMPAIRRFRAGHREIELDFVDGTTEETLRRLLAGQVDIAVATEFDRLPDLDYVRIGEQELGVLTLKDSALGRQRQIRWARFLGETSISFKGYGSMSRYRGAQLEQAGLSFTATHQIETMVAGVGLVKAGVGHLLISRLGAAALASQTLVWRPLVAPAIRRPISMMTRAGNALSPAARALVELIAASRP
ncbi:MAG: LysR family transcriptional regulator [Burkholderiaceae bacterium]